VQSANFLLDYPIAYIAHQNTVSSQVARIAASFVGAASVYAEEPTCEDLWVSDYRAALDKRCENPPETVCLSLRTSEKESAFSA
jgi:hypothetical protein